MDQKLQKAKDLILSHKEILVVLAARPDGDSLLATSALFLALKKIANEGPIFNLVDFLIPGKLSGLHKELIGDGILKYTKNELEGRNYVINVPCGEGAIDKVSWRVENNVFKLFITPSHGDINLKEVNFEQVGANYKLIILVGFSDLERLGEIYTKNKIFFDKAPKLAINGPVKGDFEMNLECDPDRSVSESIFDLLQTLKVNIDEDLAQLLLTGIIQKAGGHIGNINSRETLDCISFLLDNGAKMESVRKRSTGKRTFAMLQLQQRIFANVRQDTTGVLWSKVNNFEIKDLQIPDEDISVEDDLPFNICEGYEHAFVLFELADGTVLGRLESTSFDVNSFDDKYSISGSEGIVIFETEQSIDSVESYLLQQLNVPNGVDTAEEAVVTQEPISDKIETAQIVESPVGEVELVDSRRISEVKVGNDLESKANLDSTHPGQAKRAVPTVTRPVYGTGRQDPGSRKTETVIVPEKKKEMDPRVKFESLSSTRLGDDKKEETGVKKPEVVIPEQVQIPKNRTTLRRGLVQAEGLSEEESFDDNPIITDSDDKNASFGPPKIFGSNRFGSFAGGGPSRFDGNSVAGTK